MPGDAGRRSMGGPAVTTADIIAERMANGKQIFG
jgi:hypothetical protein